jgi:hypothetical protein
MAPVPRETTGGKYKSASAEGSFATESTSLRRARFTAEDVPDGVEAAANVPSVAANFLSFVGQKLTLPDRWRPDPALLERHAAMVCAQLQ